MPKLMIYLGPLFLWGIIGCASTPPKKKKPYEVKKYEVGFDFSSLKKSTTLYINHNNGIYYKGAVNLEKSGPGVLCLYLGTGTRCFKQSEIQEITENKTSTFKAGTLLVNVMVLSVFLALFYFLPSPN